MCAAHKIHARSYHTSAYMSSFVTGYGVVNCPHFLWTQRSVSHGVQGDGHDLGGKNQRGRELQKQEVILKPVLEAIIPVHIFLKPP